MRPSWPKSHCQVLGPPQIGKTSVTECWRREHILLDDPIVGLYYRDDGYEETVAFIAEANPEYPVVLLNPSKLEPRVVYNPFFCQKGRNVPSHAKRLAEVILGVTSNQKTQDAQNYAEVAPAYFAYLAVTGHSPASTEEMFEHANAKMWLHASSEVPEAFQGQMRRIAQTSKSDWLFETGTLRRRIAPFITCDPLRSMTSGVGKDISLLETHSLLVNCAPSDLLPPDCAGIFAGLILSDVLQYAIEHATRKRTIFGYLDEIHEYAPPTFGSLLDQSLASGLRLTLVHHHADQFPDNRVRASVESNTRIKVVFGGHLPEVRKRYAEMFFPGELNQDWQKQPRYTTETEYEEEIKESLAERSDGIKTVTRTPWLRPSHNQVIGGYDHYGMDEKLSQLASRLSLPDRQYHVLFPDGTVKHEIAPTLRRYLYNSPETLAFIQSQHEPEPPTERSIPRVSTKRTKVRPTLFNAE